MASILCGNCNYGIHYHSEPQGIQYSFISKDHWKHICESDFKTSASHDNADIYPKLYRTDTLDDDFKDILIKVWKCPKCESVMTFDNEGNLTQIFTKTEKLDLGQCIDTGIAFDDYSWDKITEDAKPNKTLKKCNPSYFIELHERGFIISADKSFIPPVYYIVSK